MTPGERRWHDARLALASGSHLLSGPGVSSPVHADDEAAGRFSWEGDVAEVASRFLAVASVTGKAGAIAGREFAAARMATVRPAEAGIRCAPISDDYEMRLPDFDFGRLCTRGSNYVEALSIELEIRTVLIDIQ